MKKDHFGNMPDGREISLYTLENDKITACVSDLGALLVRLYVPDKNGSRADVVLGFDSGEEYLDNPNCLGAIVAPVANRTKGASIVIDGTTEAGAFGEYKIYINLMPIPEDEPEDETE